MYLASIPGLIQVRTWVQTLATLRHGYRGLASKSRKRDAKIANFRRGLPDRWTIPLGEHAQLNNLSVEFSGLIGRSAVVVISANRTLPRRRIRVRPPRNKNGGNAFQNRLAPLIAQQVLVPGYSPVRFRFRGAQLQNRHFEIERVTGAYRVRELQLILTQSHRWFDPTSELGQKQINLASGDKGSVGPITDSQGF
jgi:hypothetical protein